jgi:site-specific DNA-methyltransferase (adenine-specific)
VTLRDCLFHEEPGITLYCGDAREIIPLLDLASVDLMLTDPPYPNNAGHFEDGIDAGREVVAASDLPRLMVFWHTLAAPTAKWPIVARHIWHRTNTNRPDNYETIYEFANEPERSSRCFDFPVVYPGLTGCVEATGHPTQKHRVLIQSLLALRSSTFVLDPFVGSGTTLEAAKTLGVRAIGIEIEPKWCEVAARRLRQEVLL